MIVALLAAILGTVYAQRYDFTCGQSNKTLKLLTKGDAIYLCIHWLPYEVKMGFVVKVDQHSMLEVPDSYDFISTKLPEQTNLFAQLDTNSYYSAGQIYANKKEEWVNNVMQLIVTLKEGVFTGMRWDTDCYGCNNTDECKSVKTTFIDFQSAKSTERSYKTCTQKYCGNTPDRHMCNLKVGIGNLDIHRVGRNRLERQPPGIEVIPPAELHQAELSGHVRQPAQDQVRRHRRAEEARQRLGC
jgi:hypothetical protein